MRAYTDGACRVSNPGQTSCAFAVYDGDQVVAQFSTYLGPELHTNNFAEYQGLLYLLRWAESTGTKKLNIYCDSALVVNQVMDVWDVNSADLKSLWIEAYNLRVRGQHMIYHIKGHSGDPGNDYVDLLCNQILDKELNGKII